MAGNNTARKRVVDGQTWHDFCDDLKQAGNQILRAETPATALDRAEGFRYLTRLLRIGLEMHIEYADPDFPGFFTPSHETAKIGADNPDNLYAMARVNPAHDYVIEGSRGSVSYLSIGTQKGGYETDGQMIQTGFIDDANLDIDNAGRFSVVISQQSRSGNHVAMDPASTTVIVRQTFLDRSTEQPAQLSIRRRNPGTTPEPLSAERLDSALANVSAFVQGTAQLFADWAESYLEHPNALPPADQAECQRVGGDPNIFYYHSYWALAPDEALVIHAERIPECRFWNIQINNYWLESLDYRYLRVCLNAHSAQLDAGGGATFVLAHEDPGHANWLQTGGHSNGTICMRWVGAYEHIHPTTRVCKLSELTP